MIGPSPVEERRQILGFRFPRPGFETDSPDFHVRRSSAGPGNIVTATAGRSSDPVTMLPPPPGARRTPKRCYRHRQSFAGTRNYVTATAGRSLDPATMLPPPPGGRRACDTTSRPSPSDRWNRSLCYRRRRPPAGAGQKVYFIFRHFLEEIIFPSTPPVLSLPQI